MYDFPLLHKLNVLRRKLGLNPTYPDVVLPPAPLVQEAFGYEWQAEELLLGYGFSALRVMPQSCIQIHTVYPSFRPRLPLTLTVHHLTKSTT